MSECVLWSSDELTTRLYSLPRAQIRDFRSHHRDRNLDRRARRRGPQPRHTGTRRCKRGRPHRRGQPTPSSLNLERVKADDGVMSCHDVFSLFPQAQPHLPSGAVQAGDTTTAARAEAQQTSPEAAQQVHATAEHTKGVAEHAASTAHVRTSFPSRLFG